MHLEGAEKMYSYNFVARPVCTISGTPTRARMVSFLDSSGPSLRSGQDFRHYRIKCECDECAFDAH